MRVKVVFKQPPLLGKHAFPLILLAGRLTSETPSNIKEKNVVEMVEKKHDTVEFLSVLRTRKRHPWTNVMDCINIL